MALYESVTPDAHDDPLYPPVGVWHYTYRIPDGHIVPNPPRPSVEPEQVPNRYEWRVVWLTLTVVALGVLIGVLR